MYKIQITPSWRDVKPEGFYVYIHLNPITLKPFYVGRGMEKRGWARSVGARSSDWFSLAIPFGVTVDICQDKMSYEDSCLLESWLIAKFIKEGLVIVNKSRGGEGISHFGTAVYSSLGEYFPTMSDAIRYLWVNGFNSASSSAISQCCNSLSKTAYGRAWSKVSYPVHPAKTGNEAKGKASITLRSIKVDSDYGMFDSMTDAARWLRLNGYPKAVHSAISAAISGKSKKAYNSCWSVV